MLAVVTGHFAEELRRTYAIELPVALLYLLLLRLAWFLAFFQAADRYTHYDRLVLGFWFPVLSIESCGLSILVNLEKHMHAFWY